MAIRAYRGCGLIGLMVLRVAEGFWGVGGGLGARTGVGRQARGVDLAIREQHEVRSELQAFCRTPYTDHSDSQIPRTARCRTTARSSHLGNGYGISCRYAMVLSGIVYAGMRLPLRPSAAGATTVRTPAFARVPRDLAERTRGPLSVYAATPRRARTMGDGAWRERTSHENAEDRRADQG